MTTPSADGFLWATRGRTWGFRFLRADGIEDPLGLYEDAFRAIGDEAEAYRAVDGGVVLRFADPLGREDAAGRVIPHDLVLLGRWADGVESVASGRDRAWPEIAEEFARTWAADDPPTP